MRKLKLDELSSDRDLSFAFAFINHLDLSSVHETSLLKRHNEASNRFVLSLIR
jgi:hypothetical protein